MTSALEIAAQLLAFTAAEFAAAPDLDLSERVRALLYSDFEGMAIAAPMAGADGQHFDAGSPMPIAVAYRMSGGRGWDVPLARNVVLVARNLVDGRVLFRDPFAPQGGHKRHSQRQPLDRGARPPEAQLAGWNAEITWIDGAGLGLTGLPGDWHLTLIWYDWASNDLALGVAGSRSEPNPQTVYLPAIENPDAGPEMPEPPRAPGLALAAMRLHGAPGTIRVSGRLALPRRPHMAPANPGSDSAPDAVVSLTLLALGPNAPRQGWRFTLPASVVNDTAHAQFTVDLGPGGPPLPPGPLVLWGIADEALAGPIRIDADMPLNR